MIRPCDFCGASYEAKRLDRSRFCSPKCRGRAHRAGTPVPVEQDPAPSELVDVVTRTLVGHDALGSPLGQLAVTLAVRLDAPGQRGSTVASLSRELRAVMGEVTASSAASDIVDELRRRRDIRLRRATP
jgi:hypothetical protein